MTSTTPEQLKESVHEYFDRTWGEGDFSVVDEQFADDYVGHVPLQPEDAQGPEGFKAMARTYLTAFPDVEASIDDLIVEGDTVAVRYTWNGTHQGEVMGLGPTGRTVEGSGMAFLRFEDGKRVEDWIMEDNLGLMEQLGVFPPSPGVILKMVAGKIKAQLLGG